MLNWRAHIGAFGAKHGSPGGAPAPPRAAAPRHARPRRSMLDASRLAYGRPTGRGFRHGAGLRRAGRGRRAVRHRRGLPPAGALPGVALRHPRGARSHRRHLGPVPLPRRPIGLGHAHARLRLPPVARSQGDRRRPVDPELRARGGGRARHRPARPLPPPRPARVLVVGRGALDGRGRADRYGRRRPLHLRLPADVQRLLQLRRGPRARLPRRRPVRGPRRPPPVLARGPRPRGQARRGDRQRRDRGHDRARDGGGGGARHHAAALAHLRRPAPVRGQGRRPAPPPTAGAARPPDHPLEERGPRRVFLPPRPPATGADQAAHRRHGAKRARPRLRRRHALHAALRPLGPAALHRARLRPVRGDALRALRW